MQLGTVPSRGRLGHCIRISTTPSPPLLRLKKTRGAEVEIEASEKLRLPWQSISEGEAGEWAEFHPPGGPIELHSSRKWQVTLQTGPTTSHLLSAAQLLQSKSEVVLYYPTRFPHKLAMSTILESSPADMLQSKKKALDAEPKLPQKVPGHFLSSFRRSQRRAITRSHRVSGPWHESIESLLLERSSIRHREFPRDTGTIADKGYCFHCDLLYSKAIRRAIGRGGYVNVPILHSLQKSMYIQSQLR
ncbi:hypothetical protein DFH08DRAFT_316718 [Mycena albidolilacea]|uniref:Uncharacterized protein n=1 Tax=Mycena albidolilacea TaxID=1033008 RepID=A0AAD6ZMR1_9AGAR|nr:hypothetical protein DFH08DRAFT_316718 [Mycena albidolilacea]